MINYETILSTFDNKLTLMQWLQKVEQALEGAGLESVEIHQQSPTTAYFKFVFADGTSVTTPSITLPRGPKGDTGATGTTGATGNGIASITKTGTSGLVDTYTILYTNGSTQTFTVTNGAQGEAGQDGQDGADGADGVGISNIQIGTNGVVTVTLTDETTVNAGNVFILISTGSVTSGTFTASQLADVKLVNSVIYDSDLHYYKYSRKGAGNIYYTYLDPISQDIGQYTINETTGAWTKTTDKFSAMIEDVETQMTSEGATAGQVPTADGDGGVSWQTPSGGSQLYMHNITYYKSGSPSASNNPFYVYLRIYNTSSSQMSISDFKNFLLQTGNTSCTGWGTWYGSTTRILYSITYLSASDKIRVQGYQPPSGGSGYEDADVYTNFTDTVIAV